MTWFRLLMGVLLLTFLSGCQNLFYKDPPVPVEPVVKPPVECIAIEKPKPVEKVDCPVVKAEPVKKKDYGLPVIGEIEKVVVMPAGLALNARIDTGATTSSIGVIDLEEYERDGKQWMKFNIVDPKTGKKHAFNVKQERGVLIKRHGVENVRRLVVKLRVILGKIDQVREFTLADRSNFENPVLIGRNYLMDAAVVDVRLKNSVRSRVPKK